MDTDSGYQDRHRFIARQAQAAPQAVLASSEQGLLSGLSQDGQHRARQLGRPSHAGEFGKENYKALGDLSELPDHLRFDAAQKAAQTWFEHLGRGGTAGTPTVTDACARYVRHLRATKSERAADDAEARFKNYVLNHANLAATELPKLTPTQLEGWRKSLKELPTRSGGRRGQRRSDSTLNRDMTCFGAALNLA